MSRHHDRGGGAKAANAKPKDKRPASSVLLEETQKMEWELHQLRALKDREQAKFESAPSGASSLFKAETPLRYTASAASQGRGKNKDKAKRQVHGSKGSTEREVTTTTTTTTTTTSKDAMAVATKPKKKVVLRGDECEKWGKTDVQGWLRSIGLGAYASVFGDNEIDGTVLLEVGLDDLDYMRIEALGHRKTLLKEIARLRRCVHPAPVSAAPAVAPNSCAPNASAGAAAASPSPAAPAQGDMIDEEAAEREAFRLAVEDWRRGKPSPEAADAAPETSSTRAVTASGGDLMHGQVDQEAEHAAFQEAVRAWREGGVTLAPATPQKRERTEDMLKAFEDNLKIKQTPKGAKPMPGPPAIDLLDFDNAF